MIEERAVVVDAGPGYAWVEIQRRLACGGCQADGGCGAATLAKVWGDRRARVRAMTRLPLQRGDEVIVALADGVLLRGAVLAYLLPLALLFAGALLGRSVFASTGEEPVVLFGFLGLVLGFLAVRVLSRRFRDDARYQPVIVRRVTAPAVAGSVPSTP